MYVDNIYVRNNVTIACYSYNLIAKCHSINYKSILCKRRVSAVTVTNFKYINKNTTFTNKIQDNKDNNNINNNLN